MNELLEIFNKHFISGSRNPYTGMQSGRFNVISLIKDLEIHILKIDSGLNGNQVYNDLENYFHKHNYYVDNIEHFWFDCLHKDIYNYVENIKSENLIKVENIISKY